MNKIKVLILAFISLFICGLVYADTNIESPDNAVIVGPHMGPAGTTPFVEVIKVYDTDTGTGTSLNKAMVWEITTYGDGYHVKRAAKNVGQDGSTERFAGIMISPTSKDSATYGPVGYMAIRGLCQADVSATPTAGTALCVTGQTTAGTLASITVGRESNDVGTALSATDPVRCWLK